MYTIFTSRDSAFLIQIPDVNGVVLDVSTITRCLLAYTPYDGAIAQKIDSDVLLGVFDWDTYVTNRQLWIELGFINLTAGYDPKAELIVYTSKYTSGRVIQIQIEVKDDAVSDAVLVDPLTTTIALNDLFDVSTAGATTGQVLAKATSGSYEFIAVAGTGTVTSVSAGNGMSFATITGAGPVTLGTPGTTTGSSTNAVTASSHTHALGIIDGGTW